MRIFILASISALVVIFLIFNKFIVEIILKKFILNRVILNGKFWLGVLRAIPTAIFLSLAVGIIILLSELIILCMFALIFLIFLPFK